MIYMFKIKNSYTGLFSTGGINPTWSKKGKTWSQKSHVSSHLSQLDRDDYPDTAEVIEYQMVEISKTDVKSWLESMIERRIDKITSRNKRNEEYQKELRRLEFEKLKKEFGS